MRDFSSDHRWLSLNTATVRKQGDLTAIIEACARHGIRAIDPWRDQVATIGLERAVRAVRDAGLELSGYCRGGMFTSDAARRTEVRDDNRGAIDEARALGAPCVVLVAGGLPQYSRPGSAASRDIAHARTQVDDAIAPAASYALSRLAAGDEAGFHDVLGPTVPLSRHIFRAPTRFYKTGIVFMAYLNGHQDHFTMVGGQESTRSTLHLAEMFRLADKAGLLANPELATRRMKAVLAVRGIEA